MIKPIFFLIVLFSSLAIASPRTLISIRIVKDDIADYGEGDVQRLVDPLLSDIEVIGFPFEVVEFRLNAMQMNSFEVTYDNVVNGLNKCLNYPLWVPSDDSLVFILPTNNFESTFAFSKLANSIKVINFKGNSIPLSMFCDLVTSLYQTNLKHHGKKVILVQGYYKGKNWKYDIKNYEKKMESKKIRCFIGYTKSGESKSN